MASRQRCPVCGSPNARTERPPRYEYTYCGLSGVVLEGDAVVLTGCDHCGESTSMIQNEAQLLQVIGLAIVLSGPGLTGEELAYLRSLCGISQEDLARAIGRSRRETIADWEGRGSGRVFQKPFDELNLRVVLLSLFKQRVVDSRWCCLSARHLAQFQEATASFVAHVGDLLATAPVHAPLRLRRTATTGEWRPSIRRAA